MAAAVGFLGDDDEATCGSWKASTLGELSAAAAAAAAAVPSNILPHDGRPRLRLGGWWAAPGAAVDVASAAGGSDGAWSNMIACWFAGLLSDGKSYTAMS